MNETHQRRQWDDNKKSKTSRMGNESHIKEMGYWFSKDYDPIKNGSIDGTDVVPHDRGLVRAMRSKFDPTKDPKIKGNPYCTLFVARLNYETSEKTLQSIFGKYGEIKRLRLVRDLVTGKSRGYAFIEYSDERDFYMAYSKGHKLTIDGSQVLVEFQRAIITKGWKPRRLGGGLGGKKESGQLRFGGRDRPFRSPFDPQLFGVNYFHSQKS